jgi:hypothetical protein
MARTRPGPVTRAAARAVTGPVAFFIAGAIDWLALGVRVGRARLRGRDPWP